MSNKSVWYPDVESGFNEMVAGFRDKVSLLKKPTFEALISLSPTTFDIVYIDARSSKQAMETAVIAYPLLAPGGVMIITNNTHNEQHDSACPRRGIDGFLDAYALEIKVIHQGFHVMCERRRHPLPSVPCRSEYFFDEQAPRCSTAKSKSDKTRNTVKKKTTAA
jgi:hypothetical protein